MRDRQPETPLACVPGAIPAAERPAHFALVRRLFGEVAESREPLANGYAFRFPPEALEAVARFVANERKCCPFLAFVVEVPPAVGPVWLRLTGPEGTPALLEAELSI
ncbi:MAG TPA: hypothetical protein VHG51_07435 [Longimicrobiaceae bacterium]|nr:hypothetical protein [Longimicrobiaceae bacterium]